MIKPKPTISVVAPKDLGILVNQVFNESDRGFVIAASAYLEKTIDGLWAPRKLKLTISQKIDLLSAMFLEKKYTDVIQAMNKIRNKAAHDYSLFSLKTYSSQLRSDVFTPASKFAIFKKIGSLNLDFSKAEVTGFDPAKIQTIQNLIDNFKDSKYKNRLNFLMVTLSLVTYIEAVRLHPVNKIKKFKFDFS